MKLMYQKEYALTKKNKKVLGPHKCVQTVVARGKINKMFYLK